MILKKITILSALFLTAAAPVCTASAGTYQAIAIDADFSDWAGVPVLNSDAADNPGFVDVANIQIANDNNYLYIRATYHSALSLGTSIALDIDQNVATGFDIFGLGLIGSEAGWQNDFAFAEATGVFNSGALAGDFFGGGHALLAPFADGTSMEWALSLNSTFASGGAPVFPDGSFNILLWTDQGEADVSAPISYTLAAVPEPTALALLGLGGFGAWFTTARRRTASRICK
jgi:hypothetical protein